VGPQYLCFLSLIFVELIKVYRWFSENISNSVRLGGMDPMIRPMKTVRRDILKLVQTYMEKEHDFNFFN